MSHVGILLVSNDNWIIFVYMRYPQKRSEKEADLWVTCTWHVLYVIS